MKNKNYVYDKEIHDITKIKRCLYTPGHEKEINNPVTAVAEIQLEGQLTLDEQVKRIMARTLAKKLALAEKNSVQDIADAFDFDIPDPTYKTPFEVQSENIDIYNLEKDAEISNKANPFPLEEGEATEQSEVLGSETTEAEEETQ